MKKSSWKIRALALTLMAVCWLSGCSAHKEISVTAAETQEETRELSLNTETEAETQPEAEPEKSGGNTGMIIFLVIALAAAGGLGYYFKIVRPKQQAAMDEDEFEDDGYGEDDETNEAYGEPDYLTEDDFDDKDSK